MSELTDPNIPAVNKGNKIAPPFTPDEAATLDHQLQVIEGPALPLPFMVTNMRPDFAEIRSDHQGIAPQFQLSY